MRSMYKPMPAWLTGIALLVAIPAISQEKKELTFDQIFTRPVNITEPLPAVRGWADKDHFIETRAGKALTVDVKTGQTADYTPPPATGRTVSVRGNDFYVQEPNGGA